MLGLWVGAGVPQLLDVNLLSRAAQLDIRLDARLLAFGSVLCAISMVIFGLAPVLSGSRLSLVAALTGGRVTGASTGRVRLARGLVVVQLAVSLVLLTGAGLFIRSLQSLASIDIGVESRNTWIVWTRPGQTALDERALRTMYEAGAASLRQLPGVREASLSYGALFPNFPRGSAIQAIDGPLQPTSATTEALWRFSAPRLLGAVGIPLIAGRDFSDRDHQSAAHVAIVNQVLARDLFGAGDPIGRRFRFTNGGEPIEIVGLMRDTVFESPREAPQPTFYLPHTQAEGRPGGLVWLAVRPASAGDELPSQIRRTLRELSPNLAILSIERMGDALDRARAQERLLAIVSIGFAAVAAVLTSIGLYGIIAFTTARRLHEVGVRLALGATSGSVVRLVLRDTMVMMSIGIAIGAPAALALSSLVESQLYGVAAHDPLTLFAATALMACVAVAAGYLPARRAAMTDPTIVLRGA
jgi:predicted permease